MEPKKYKMSLWEGETKKGWKLNARRNSYFGSMPVGCAGYTLKFLITDKETKSFYQATIFEIKRGINKIMIW